MQIFGININNLYFFQRGKHKKASKFLIKFEICDRIQKAQDSDSQFYRLNRPVQIIAVL